jgi:hypothetical protein
LNGKTFGLLYASYILFVILLVLIQNNISFASDSPPLINPFIGSIDVCGDGKDNDGNGFVDDNCGTAALKVMTNMSGAVTNISSVCHEDCGKEGDE